LKFESAVRPCASANARTLVERRRELVAASL
jgi:hypothetical protein